jgi:hypothetical protein
VPCPERKKLEAGHGKLGELVSRSISPWPPDGTAELLDDVVGEVSEYIQSRHHLVVVEGFQRSLAEMKDLLEHVNGGHADPGLEGSRFLLRVIFIFVFVLVSDGLFVRVNAPVTPSLLTLFKGFKLSARHQHFLPGLGAGSIGISSPRPGWLLWHSHCRGQVWSGRTMQVVSQSCDGCCGSMVRGPCRRSCGSLANVGLMNYISRVMG